ncbi:MAG: HK97 gp10 family phage protein [Acidithiobacillus sp.]|nr:HK97 gp10 family phage protein [Acidithiobacillus sp.]
MAMGSFAIALQGFEKKAADQARIAVQKIAMEAFQRVIMRSPVDTGRFRANWGVSVGSPYAGVDINSFDPDGSVTAAKAMQAVQAWNGQGDIFLCNNLPYSIVLEFGHSGQAPQGMVRLTITEMGGVAQQVARQ